jgi:SAM-dependent methyltransferase
MSELTPEAVLWTLLRGAIGTRVAAIVSELGVADALADGPRPVAEVAADVGADADTLHRYLRALASEGVFAEVEPGVFRNTPASALLGRESSWGSFAQLFGGVWYETIGNLDASGEKAFEADFWAWLAEHPRERTLFDRAMGQGKERPVERLAGFGWNGETVVDVGGGNGSFLLELFARQPGLRGIVYDLPETVRDEAQLAAAGIEFVEGSFFERVPEGDVFVLGTVLHDWDDESATRILKTIRRSAREGSRLLVIDRVLPPGNEPDGSKWLDILMLALLGGKERNEAQWRELLAAGGFEPVRFHEALIEAVPAG